MTPDLSGPLAARHAAARTVIRALGLDTVIVSHLPNIQYLTGFAGTAGLVLLTSNELLLIVDGRYRTAVAEQQAGSGACPGLSVQLVEGSYDDTLARVLESRSGRIGFEGAHMTVAARDGLVQRLLDRALELVPSEGIVESLRITKDASEIAVFREAARRIAAVAEGVLADLRVGLTEREVGRALEAGLSRMGFAKPAFDTIVASGPDSALPHARAGDRRLAAGDLVVIDFGGMLDGYAVDVTRTVSMGEPTPEVRRLYDAVHAAHASAVEAVRPGQAPVDVDAAARAVLGARGFGEYFVHGTGHGLGLEVHEAPRVGPPRPAAPALPGWARQPEPDRLEPGMVITIEPGAYLPGRAGVRIEDDVLVTGEGCEVLTTIDRSLRVC